jgi:hypothetical protein
MALIVRIDVDRPYGKQGFVRHVASRISSDYYLPQMRWLRYLDELKTILGILNANGHAAHVFFRACTRPTAEVRALMETGGHQYGLHLENSRTQETFQQELYSLQHDLGFTVSELSKHGSGRFRYGWNHYAPYEPEKYLRWGQTAGMKVFFGNLEDPQIRPTVEKDVLFFPSAFWLEPKWRDTRKFPIEWLLHDAVERDVVMLLHPDNVTSDARIMKEFLQAIEHLQTILLPRSIRQDEAQI